MYNALYKSFCIIHVYNTVYNFAVPLSPGCRNCRNCRTCCRTVGHCRTTVGLSDCRTVGRLSDGCRTVGLLSDCRLSELSDSCRTVGLLSGCDGQRTPF